MKKNILITLLSLPLAVSAQTYDFDMTKPQPVYSDSIGYGYDFGTAAPTKKSAAPFYFSVKVPDGNYLVKVTLGSKKQTGETTVRGESRRLYVEPVTTKKKELKTFSFIVNKHSPQIDAKSRVSIKQREKDYLRWDDRLTLEFNGKAPRVQNIHIERDDSCPTLYLCGNSTVTDQENEPWASWGQMIPLFMDDGIAVANYAESGLTASSFLAQHRLDKILSTLKKGDIVICEFGHNDQKEKNPGSGAYYNFSFALKKFIDNVRAKDAYIVFCTPTQRRRFDDAKKHIVESHGDYPKAMTVVAERENVPVIDLHSLTRTFFETLGYEDSKKALVHYPANTFPGQDRDLADNTHFNTFGAYEVAKMVAQGLKNLGEPYSLHVCPKFQGFDPAHPDSYATFYWPLTKRLEIAKPDGN